MSLTVAVKAVSTCVSAGKMLQNQKIQKKIMTNLDNCYQIINSTNQKMDELSGKVDEISIKADAIAQKTDAIAQKTDALIIRDLLAANLALDDIKATDVWDSAELLQLENMYRMNTGLPNEGQTNGIRNSQIRVMSYLGLFQIGILKGMDDMRLTRYVLHMFETGEAVVMKDLFPEFCQEVFGSYFRQVEEEYKQRKNHWEMETELYKQAHDHGMIGGALGGGKAVGILGIMVRTLWEGQKLMAKWMVQSALDRECMAKKIEICRQVAKKMLAE